MIALDFTGQMIIDNTKIQQWNKLADGIKLLYECIPAMRRYDTEKAYNLLENLRQLVFESLEKSFYGGEGEKCHVVNQERDHQNWHKLNDFYEHQLMSFYRKLSELISLSEKHGHVVDYSLSLRILIKKLSHILKNLIEPD